MFVRESTQPKGEAEKERLVRVHQLLALGTPHRYRPFHLRIPQKGYRLPLAVSS